MIRVHHCAPQINVAEERNEPPAPKCKCRKFVRPEEATRMVDAREASWVVTKRTRGFAEVTCSLCGGDPSVTNCAKCGGKGASLEAVVWNEYNNDIVLVSELPKDDKETKRTSVLKMKTPRVATIEKAHIERAYVYENKAAQERIEEYGRLTREALLFVGPKKIPTVSAEPADNPKTGEGRNFDYGRSI